VPRKFGPQSGRAAGGQLANLRRGPDAPEGVPARLGRHADARRTKNRQRFTVQVFVLPRSGYNVVPVRGIAFGCISSGNAKGV
jgi:hypothetical protein